MRRIKVRFDPDKMLVSIAALNAMDRAPISYPDKTIRNFMLSVRDELEPKINKHKRNDSYAPSLKMHEAYVLILALQHYPQETGADAPYLRSCSRQIQMEIEPQLP